MLEGGCAEPDGLFMTENDDDGGNPSYVAYEYQIEVSAWRAVDLLLARRVCNEIAIEAKSKEDFEADIEHQFPTTGLAAEKALLTVQIKSKSTGAWSSASFAKILRGELIRGDDGAPPAKGPPPRIRPLELLRKEEQRIYLFITDAAVDPALFPFKVKYVGDPSDAKSLPHRSGKALTKEEDAGQIARRISILDSVTRELAKFRLEQLLRSHAQVPEQHISKCVASLVQEIRERMLSRSERVLTRAQLLNVISRYGGLANSARSLDNYVEPKSFRRIERMLRTEHAVVITGPSGTGKTMTADFIEGLLLKEQGYEVVGAGEGPEVVWHALRSAGSYLFHLKDPFGKTRYVASARPWTSELLNLLKEAGPDKKFLVTTRSDVIHESGITLHSELAQRQLDRFSVSLETTDYDAEARARIYDNHVAELKGRGREFAIQNRKSALAQLLRPFEIERFVLAIKLSSPPQDLDRLIGQSQIDSIARVVCLQITDSAERENSIGCAAVLWALILGCGAANRENLRAIRRALRRYGKKVDLEAFAELMVQARNLRDAGGDLTFLHPQTAKGFVLAMRADEDATADTLSALIEVLVSMDDLESESDDWGAETANKFRRQLLDEELELDLALPPHISKALDRHLEKTLASDTAGRFSNRVRNYAYLSSKSSLGGRFARSLVSEPKSHSGGRKRDHFWGFFWSVTEADKKLAPKFAKNDLCLFIARHFVTDMLMETSNSYRLKLADYLYSVDPSLATVALDALRRRLAGLTRTVNNLRAVVWLSLKSNPPPIDELISFFLDLEQEKLAAGEKENVRLASQEILDAGYRDFVLEGFVDDMHIPAEGLRTCIRWLRIHRPSSLHGHPFRDGLLSHWMIVGLEDAETGNASADEIDLLFDLSLTEEHRAGAWHIVGKWGNRGYLDRLCKEIRENWRDGPDLRVARVSALSGVAKEEFAKQIREAISAGSEAAQLTTVSDCARAHVVSESIDGSTKKLLRASLRDELSAELKELFDLSEKGREHARRGTDQFDPGPIEDNVKSLALQIVAELPEDIQAALMLAIPYMKPLKNVAIQLAGSDEPYIAAAAVTVLGRADSATGSTEALLWKYLVHDDYRVRAAALASLARRVTGEDRHQIVRTGREDESSPVRLAFATSMQAQNWPEALGALSELLADERDFDEFGAHGDRETSFDVARAAAAALAVYPSLPETILSDVISRVSLESSEAGSVPPCWEF
ncbi:nSTAND3 domain-containing NTPase [Rhizobium laguerreae]|uniref:nSTAND3 domain-containing NTPase n=1 Tax=Rhizobium laguerreae TaxID=1076926 RepID=UPI001C914339|nr:hypothetical protein [Rhizobium laguerreae]MBY3211793.1 hypothetical protein [Rhizobium laguerreae]